MTAPEHQETPGTILHGGALGDLVLTLQLAEQIKSAAMHVSTPTTVISRVDLSGCLPPGKIYEFVNIDTIDLHKLFIDAPSEISPRLRQLLMCRNILNTLTDTNSPLHHNLVNLSMGGRGSRRAVASETHDSPNGDIQTNEIISLETRIGEKCESHVIQQWRDRLSEHQLNFKPAPPSPPITTASTPPAT
ncbi:MAG: hypothetical protein AB7N71_14460, partial [Phycisphaerae bacterium]